MLHSSATLCLSVTFPWRFHVFYHGDLYLIQGRYHVSMAERIYIGYIRVRVYGRVYIGVGGVFDYKSGSRVV